MFFYPFLLPFQFDSFLVLTEVHTENAVALVSKKTVQSFYRLE